MSMINYNDPNSPWMPPGYDPYEGMSDEEREKAGCMQGAMMAVFVIILFALMALFSSCTTTRYVTVPEVHEHWQHTTDTILRRDSIVSQQTTLIREVDSATMARYGIQMSALQTAWLIQTDRLQRELSELRQTKADTTVIRDSIPVPVEVIKEVPARLTWWQQTRISVGGILLWLLIFFALWKIIPKVLRYFNR